MVKNIFFGLLFSTVSFVSFGQEKPIYIVEWEELDNKLSEEELYYVIELKEITPSLSFINQRIATGNYQLMEIDLTIDLRTQHLRKDSTDFLQLPENKYIQSDYALAIPSGLNERRGRITITGSGGYNSSSTNNGGIKNTAYRDAGSYTGIYCPVTGVPLTY
ncbi:hypothetical protein [Aquimarina sp. 2201CG14-23]|uniref:hypothetical protein n=1 Tax=Aquimarina mycalae TaxID=3040073 RepID=UPI002477F383|nr:hypothetical protein [Aquimarina sp. 2201CG14-23]MDH7445760.1 hypothetical protein [Aquimarina sp. 2201CG14-23]